LVHHDKSIKFLNGHKVKKSAYKLKQWNHFLKELTSVALSLFGKTLREDNFSYQISNVRSDGNEAKAPPIVNVTQPFERRIS